MQVGVKEWLFANVHDLCQPNQKDSLTCPHNQVRWTQRRICRLKVNLYYFGRSISPQAQYGEQRNRVVFQTLSLLSPSGASSVRVDSSEEIPSTVLSCMRSSLAPSFQCRSGSGNGVSPTAASCTSIFPFYSMVPRSSRQVCPPFVTLNKLLTRRIAQSYGHQLLFLVRSGFCFPVSRANPALRLVVQIQLCESSKCAMAPHGVLTPHSCDRYYQPPWILAGHVAFFLGTC